MSRPWMPLYCRDYLADTAGLDAAESGAYLHLIMHYWINGALPLDDRQLSRIARMTPGQWKSARPLIEPFFDAGWKHGRIEFELTEAARISMAGKAGGKASGRARRERSLDDKRTTDERSLNDPPTKPEALPSQGGGVGDARASLISPEAMTLTAEIAAICGFPTPDHWPPGWCGAPYRVETMLQGGWQREIMLVSTREIMAKRGNDPPDGIKYFEKAFARAHAQQSAPLPVVKLKPTEIIHETGRQHRGNRNGITAALERQAEQFEREARDGDEVCEAAPRLLSNG